MGDGLQSNEEATHALVFMVVAVNSTWKLPFAHFFTKTATGEPSTKRCRRSIQVVCGSRKRGFVGFLVYMKTFIKLYEIYIQTGYLKYLMAYKYSQDHVELLFCTVRGSLWVKTTTPQPTSSQGP